MNHCYEFIAYDRTQQIILKKSFGEIHIFYGNYHSCDNFFFDFTHFLLRARLNRNLSQYIYKLINFRMKFSE